MIAAQVDAPVPVLIVPPDGDMSAYMASLDKLYGREDRVYYPAHGPRSTTRANSCAE